MRIIVSLAFVLALNGWAQTPPEKRPAQTVQVEIPAAAVIPISALTPQTLVATVNGRKVTAGELQAVLRQLTPQMQQQAQRDRRKFVEQYALLRELSEQGKKEGLDQKSPWKEAIEYGTVQVLYQAVVNRKFEQLTASPEELKKNYEANPGRFQQAHVRAIYLPFSSAPVSQADSTGKKLLTEDEAKTKAQDLMKQLKEGADFVKLVKENSGDPASAAKDGDFGFIKKNDPMPQDLKTAIFSAKAGELAGPMRQANGYYIFRVEEVNTQPFEQVQATLLSELKSQQFAQWMAGLQKGLDVQMVGPSAPSVVPVEPQVGAPAPAAPPAAAPPKK
jgi:peptidyl-prolyl cis-trans isomerase C